MIQIETWTRQSVVWTEVSVMKCSFKMEIVQYCRSKTDYQYCLYLHTICIYLPKFVNFNRNMYGVQRFQYITSIVFLATLLQQTQGRSEFQITFRLAVVYQQRSFAICRARERKKNFNRRLLGLNFFINKLKSYFNLFVF